MKKLFLSILAAGASLGVAAANPSDSIPFANTIEILPGDSEETIIAKAAHVVPKPNQMGGLENEFIAFVHFGPNTFSRREWGTGMEDPKLFNPSGLDTDQWVKAMKDAGMKMVVLTVKHHDGYVIYQSRYTDHGIMQSPFMNGKADVLKNLSASCHKYGMKLGVYLSPADLFQIESPTGLYGNLSAKTERVIPRDVPGRPFADNHKFKFVVDDYNEYFLNQLFELLTEYGPIHEVWFDGAKPKDKGGQTYNYEAWLTMIRTLAPEAVVFGRGDVRWCGNEAGATRDTEWNVVPFYQHPDSSGFSHAQKKDIGSIDMLKGARFLHYLQPETDTSIREGWFYRDEEHQKSRSADDVFDIYERSVGGNATFILNIPPNREGRFSDRDVAVLQEVGKRIRETYGIDLLAGAKGAKEILDSDKHSYIDITEPVIIELPQATKINRFVIQEPVDLRGERIAEHALDAWIDGEWKEVVKATNVGYKRILRFPDVTTRKLRLRVEKSRLTPAICKVSAHHYEARPPQLAISRDKDENVIISVARQQFGWKTDGSNSSERLSAGYTVRYSVDGSEPTINSTLYTSPFNADAAVVKAKAFLNGMEGAVASEQLGMKEADWSFDNETAGTVVIGLGQKRAVKGFAYTPGRGGDNPSTVAGEIFVSDNAKKWRRVEAFELGNLTNDPTRRLIHFKKAAKAKFVKIVFSSAPAKVTLRNVDLF